MEMSSAGGKQEYAPLSVADNQEGALSDGELSCAGVACSLLGHCCPAERGFWGSTARLG